MKRLTGKGGKLNTSPVEPVAASSWAVGQFLSISCEAFRCLTRYRLKVDPTFSPIELRQILDLSVSPFSFRFCPTPSSQSPLGASPFSQPISLILSSHSIWLPRREGGHSGRGGIRISITGPWGETTSHYDSFGQGKGPTGTDVQTAAARGMTGGEWVCTNDYSIYPAHSSYISSNLYLSSLCIRVVSRIRI